MAQITLTLDLTVETAEALRVLAVALNGPQARTNDEAEQMKLSDFDKPEEKTPAKPPAANKPKTGTGKKDAKEAAPEAPAEEKSDDTEISLTDVRAVALKLSNSGKQATLQEIFKKYGAKKLSDIPQADYAALMEDLEEAANGK